MGEELVTTKEASKYLRVSRAKFVRLQKWATFPRPVRLGSRCLRWRLTEIVAFTQSAQRRG